MEKLSPISQINFSKNDYIIRQKQRSTKSLNDIAAKNRKIKNENKHGRHEFLIICTPSHFRFCHNEPSWIFSIECIMYYVYFHVGSAPGFGFLGLSSHIIFVRPCFIFDAELNIHTHCCFIFRFFTIPGDPLNLHSH